MLYDYELKQLATALVCAADYGNAMENAQVVRLHDVLALISTYSDQGTTVTSDAGLIALKHEVEA